MTALVLAREDRLACRDWIRTHSKSFFLSSLLLPAAARTGPAWPPSPGTPAGVIYCAPMSLPVRR